MDLVGHMYKSILFRTRRKKEIAAESDLTKCAEGRPAIKPLDPGMGSHSLSDLELVAKLPRWRAMPERGEITFTNRYEALRSLVADLRDFTTSLYSYAMSALC